jgi:hypothetical protein
VRVWVGVGVHSVPRIALRRRGRGRWGRGQGRGRRREATAAAASICVGGGRPGRAADAWLLLAEALLPTAACAATARLRRPQPLVRACLPLPHPFGMWTHVTHLLAAVDIVESLLLLLLLRRLVETTGHRRRASGRRWAGDGDILRLACPSPAHSASSVLGLHRLLPCEPHCLCDKEAARGGPHAAQGRGSMR